ncbi:uncharacterized protein DS421_20g687860 [Arachis hypogaea]|nr:uncharacterized protein DS421_20g687860 [Arachis hypogaea]
MKPWGFLECPNAWKGHMEVNGCGWLVSMVVQIYIEEVVHRHMMGLAGHWYLMVIAFREHILYHLDALMTKEASIRRKAVIRFVGNVVCRIIAAPHFPLEFLKTAGGVMCFRISDASRLPSFQTRYLFKHFSATSGIWVLNWMAMGDDSMIRMHTALGLLMSPFNESTEWMKKNGSIV